METCELTGRARAFLARQAMLRQGDTVIVALSGGADSMALFHFLFLESRRLSLRHVPQLIFKATDSIEYGTHISKLLHDLEPEGEPSQEAASQEEEE